MHYILDTRCMGLNPLQRCSLYILQPQPTRQFYLVSSLCPRHIWHRYVHWSSLLVNMNTQICLKLYNPQSIDVQYVPMHYLFHQIICNVCYSRFLSARPNNISMFDSLFILLSDHCQKFSPEMNDYYSQIVTVIEVFRIYIYNCGIKHTKTKYLFTNPSAYNGYDIVILTRNLGLNSKFSFS